MEDVFLRVFAHLQYIRLWFRMHVKLTSSKRLFDIWQETSIDVLQMSKHSWMFLSDVKQMF